jgi:chaperonin GroEL
MKRYVVIDEKMRNEILKGVNSLCDAVKITMGPSGQNVLIDVPGRNPIITKDGVTVAKSIDLTSPIPGMGARVIRQASEMTAEEAGDGTTTSAVLSQAIFKAGLRLISSGYQQQDIKSAFEKASRDIIENLNSLSHKIKDKEDLYNIAKISVNNETSLARKITDAFEAVGNDGVVTVEEAKGTQTTVTIKEGYQFNRGFISPYFVNEEKTSKCVMEDPLIITAFKKFDTVQDLVKILEYCLAENKPLLLICDDVEGDALKTLIVNKVRGNLKVCVVKPPYAGIQKFEALKDISAITGGKLFDANTSLKDFVLEDAGSCERVEITKNTCLLVGNKQNEERVKERIDSIKYDIGSSTEDKEVMILKERLTKIRGKIAVLNIGGSTEVEIREKRDRVDDALCATSSAVKSGYVAGGGLALVNSALMSHEKLCLANNVSGSSDDFDESIYKVFLDACLEPFKQIVRNTGKSPDHILEKIKELNEGNEVRNIGYNSMSDEFSDLLATGVIDPLLVTTCAVKNATSAACMLLTVGCVLVSENQEIEDIYV